MKVEPRTAKEVDEMGLLPVGVYDFYVAEATDTTSKKGNDMAVLKLKIEDDTGRQATLVDYLVSIDSMAYKIRHFADSVGLLAAYERGDLPADMMAGRVGKCKVGIKPADGEYRAKNVVNDYLPSTVKPAPKPVVEELDDEIPF